MKLVMFLQSCLFLTIKIWINDGESLINGGINDGIDGGIHCFDNWWFGAIVYILLVMTIWRWLLLFKTNDNDCLLLFTIVCYCLRPSYCNDNDCLLLFLLLCDCHYNSIVIYTHINMTSPAMLQQGPYPEEASTWPENLQSIHAILGFFSPGRLDVCRLNPHFRIFGYPPVSQRMENPMVSKREIWYKWIV